MTPLRPRPLVFVLVVLLALTPAVQPSARAVSCDFSLDRTPASGVPQQLWGDLLPVSTGLIPAARDTTDYNEFQQIRLYKRLWTSLDVEDGWIFAAYTHGLQVWDARGTNATNPVRTTTASGPFPAWPTNPHVEEEEPVRDVDAPPGNPSILAVATAGGINIFDASSKTALEHLYSDPGKELEQVYAGRAGGLEIAVAASTDSGAFVYDLTAAAQLSAPCSGGCGVYAGRLGARPGAKYVDGVSDAAESELWVAVAGGGRGIEIWNVTDPGSPLLVLSDLDEVYLSGVALWRSGESYYLGTRIGGRDTFARTYDVSCIASAGGCIGIGPALWEQQLPGDSGAGAVTFSRANGNGGTPFLYYSAFLFCPSGEQHEWLFDVSNPANPRDVTPPAVLIDGAPTGYWGWYYRGNPTGFNHVRPRNGKFFGQYFYRAAFSLLDIHILSTPTAPSAEFNYQPSEVYSGQTVAFSDASTGGPFSWFWEFEDGSPGTSSTQNPSVVFSSAGAKTVSLVASNDVGPSTPIVKVVPVLDPAPAVSGIAISPPAPVVCQPVTLTAIDATGRPPVTIGWEVRDDVGTPLAGGSGNPFTWSTDSVGAGSYSAAVELANPYGAPASAETTLTLAALGPLPASGTFSPTSAPPLEGTIAFDVSAPGATEFCWDFGDGSEFPAGCLTYPSRWSKDPLNGPSPSHTYAGLGTYSVTVQVRNCLDPTPRTSAVHEVEIVSTEPLVAGFQAVGVCFGGAGCFVEAGVPVDFSDSTSGSPSLYEYDWEGDGTVDEASGTPVTRHAFSRSGTFTPTLTVHRGGDTDTYVHPQQFYVTSLFDDGFESGDLAAWSASSP